MNNYVKRAIQEETERLVCVECGADLRLTNKDNIVRIEEKCFCDACARRFKQPAIDLIEYALQEGCITRFDVHKYVRYYANAGFKGTEYTSNELFYIECEYERAHPNMYPILIPLCTWEIVDSGDTYEKNGVRYSYLPSKQQLYSSIFRDAAAGFGPVDYSFTGKTVLTSWDKLLEKEKEHCCKWNDTAWRKVCEDYKRNPQMHCPALDELIKRRG